MVLFEFIDNILSVVSSKALKLEHTCFHMCSLIQVLLH